MKTKFFMQPHCEIQATASTIVDHSDLFPLAYAKSASKEFALRGCICIQENPALFKLRLGLLPSRFFKLALLPPVERFHIVGIERLPKFFLKVSKDMVGRFDRALKTCDLVM
jgi:hypothetical protein